MVVVNEDMCGSVPEGAIGSRNIPVNPIGIDEARQISIQKALNGFIVVVGCKIVVFEKQETMLKEIGRYLDNPAQVEKEYLSKK